MALECQSGGVSTGVLARVVQGLRCAADERFSKEQIDLLEERRVRRADEQRRTQQDTPRADGFDHQGVHAFLVDLLGPHRILVGRRAAAVPRIGSRWGL